MGMMEPQVAVADAAAPVVANGNKEFLTLKLGDEEYAIDILRVQEIRGYVAPTHIAAAPPFIKGVLNLRGDMVPILDLRIIERLMRSPDMGLM